MKSVWIYVYMQSFWIRSWCFRENEAIQYVLLHTFLYCFNRSLWFLEPRFVKDLQTSSEPCKPLVTLSCGIIRCDRRTAVPTNKHKLLEAQATQDS